MSFIQMVASKTPKLENHQLTDMVAMILISKIGRLPPIFLLEAERFKRHYSLKMPIAFTYDQGNPFCQSLVRQGYCSTPCFWRPFPTGPGEPFSWQILLWESRNPEESLPFQWTEGVSKKNRGRRKLGKVSMHELSSGYVTFPAVL